MSILNDPPLERLLASLHGRSDEQIPAMNEYYARQNVYAGALPGEEADRIKTFRSDKLVALDRDKAEFCYLLCRASQARRVVEAGTSYGVSMLYLAAAVRDNMRAAGGDNAHGDNIGTAGGDGVVIGTEYEPAKAAAARAHFEQTGLAPFIDLREGDLRLTLQRIDGPIDFVLLDIWTPMARPALELVMPHLRQGAMVVCDNTKDHRAAYADLFAFLDDPANGFRTMTLPFGGGLELSVRCGA